MFNRFTDRARKIMGLARVSAQETASTRIGTEHILLGLLRENSGVAANVLRNLAVKPKAIRRELKRLAPTPAGAVPLGVLPFTQRARQSIELAAEEASSLEHTYIGSEHLLLGLLGTSSSTAGQALLCLGLRLGDVREEVLEILGFEPDRAPAKPKKRKTRRASETPAIDAFTRDLVVEARNKTLEYVVPREDDQRRLIAALTRRQRANALLVGAEGVGRRSLVHGLAHAIARRDVPCSFHDARLVQLDAGLLVAGTKARGQLEERIKALCNESRRVGNVFLVFDDFEATLNWPTSRGSARLLRQFMPALAAGDLRCIGRIGTANYEANVVTAPDVARLFEVVTVAAPEGELLERIVRLNASQLETHHDVRITEHALATAIAASKADSLGQPGAALTLLDHTCAQIGSGMRRFPEHVRALSEAMELLEKEKEQAVAAREFERAAVIRDALDGLKRDHKVAWKDWIQTRDPLPTVDGSLVAQVAARIPGREPAPAKPSTPRPASEFEQLQAWSVLPPAKIDVQRRTAIVLLPAGAAYDRLFTEAIAPALASHDLHATRAVDLYDPRGGLAATASALRCAEVVVADASGRDPGVACGLGMALTLGRCPLLLVHDEGDLPSSLRTLRAIPYDPLDSGALREHLKRAVEGLLAVVRVAPTAS